jgi:hypothetical protein
LHKDSLVARLRGRSASWTPAHRIPSQTQLAHEICVLPGKSSKLKKTHRRAAVLLARLLANMGVAAPTPLLDRFHQPIQSAKTEQRWFSGFCADQPEEWDDPYRFFRW